MTVLPLLASGRLIAAFALLSLGAFACMAIAGTRLKTAASPHAMLSFQLASDPARISAMLEAWGEQGLEWARLNLALDYLFIPLYAITLASACAWLGDAVPSLQAVSRIATLLAFGAGLFDAIENAIGLRILSRRETGLALPMSVCAKVKWALVALCVAFILAGSTQLAR